MILSAAMNGSLDVTANVHNSSLHCSQGKTSSRHQALSTIQSPLNLVMTATHAIAYRGAMNKETQLGKISFSCLSSVFSCPAAAQITAHASLQLLDLYTRTSVPRCAADVKATLSVLFSFTRQRANHRFNSG